MIPRTPLRDRPVAALALLSALVIAGLSIGTDTAGALGIGPTITTSALPSGTIGSSYAVTLGVSGGTAPYTWSIATGGLPGGLVLNSAGVLSGIPGVVGNTVVTLKCTDSTGLTTTRRITLAVVRQAPVAAELAIITKLGRLFELGTSTLSTAALSGAGNSVAITATPFGAGWVVSKTGHVTPIGGAPAFGSLKKRQKQGDVAAIALTRDARGYWIATGSGQVFAFGNARVLGRPPRLSRDVQIVAMAGDPAASGYWLLASSGSVYRYGAAADFAPPGQQGMVAIAPTSSGAGYWLVSRAGEVRAFGDAAPLPSLATNAGATVVAAVPTPSGMGLWLVTNTGRTYSLGAAAPLTSTTALAPAANVVGAA